MELEEKVWMLCGSPVDGGERSPWEAGEASPSLGSQQRAQMSAMLRVRRGPGGWGPGRGAEGDRGAEGGPAAGLSPSEVYSCFGWFRGGASRAEAAALLAGAGPGDFVVRRSRSFPGCFVLSVADGKGTIHLPALPVLLPAGDVVWSIDGGLTKFRDLVHLVEFYQVNGSPVLPALLAASPPQPLNPAAVAFANPAFQPSSHSAL